MRTQPVSSGVTQGGPSVAVKVNFVPLAAGALFSSMSLSKISPLKRFEVVVVLAITASPWISSQQSYVFPQPPDERQGSSAGTTSLHAWVRKSTRLWLAAPEVKPTMRAWGSVESGSSANVRSEQDTAPQVWKLRRMALNTSVEGASGVPCESIWKVRAREGHQMQTPALFLVRT